MRPGARFLLHLPSELAYGAAGAPPSIPPASDLIFAVELLAVASADDTRTPGR